MGSSLVIDGDGNFEGSVSGGCVEGAVVEEAAGFGVVDPLLEDVDVLAYNGVPARY